MPTSSNAPAAPTPMRKENGPQLAALTSLFGNEPANAPRSGDTSLGVHATEPTAPPTIPGYTIERELGRGGMGVVYLAQDEQLHRHVAIKVILGGALASAVQRQRFLFEAEMAARLRHPNVVQVFEAGTHDGYPFIVTEYVPGGTLAHFLHRARGRLTWRFLAQLLVELAHGMHAAHSAGVVHRDLKPGNVLLAADPAVPLGFVPKIADFGLAKAIGEPDRQLTATGDLIGTPNYMAPEQARGERHLGPAMDVYALGAIFYEALTGTMPYAAASAFQTIYQVIHEDPARPRKFRPDIPHDLEVICLKCLAKEPSQRYASAAELAADLQRWLDDRPIHARPSGYLERAIRWCRRNRALAASLAALIVVVLLSFGLLTWLYRTAEEQRAHATLALARAQQVLDDMTDPDDGIGAFAERGSLTAGQRRVLDKAANYYRDFAREYRHDPTQMSAVATSLFKVGTLLSDVDRPQESQATLNEAIGLFRELERRGRLQPRQRRDLGAALHNLAVQEAHAANFARAVPLLKEAIAVQQGTLDLTPDEVIPWDYLANHWQLLGRIQLDQGEREEARRSLTECVRLRREAAKRFSDANWPKERLALSLGLMAEVLAHQGQWPEAFEALAEARALIAEELRLAPNQGLMLAAAVDLGMQHVKMLRGHGQMDRALAVLSELRPQCERLCADRPGVMRHREHLALSYTWTGDLEAQQGRHQSASQAYATSVRVLEQFRRDFPQYLHATLTLGGTLCNLGTTLSHLGQFDEALATLDRAENILRGLLRAAPTHEQAQLFLRNTLIARAQVCEWSGRYPAALSMWTKLYDTAPPTDHAEYHFRLALNHARLGQEEEARNWLARGVGQQASYIDLVRRAWVLSRLAETASDLVLRRLHMDEAQDYLRQALDRGFHPPSVLRNMPELGFLIRQGVIQELLRTKHQP